MILSSRLNIVFKFNIVPSYVLCCVLVPLKKKKILCFLLVLILNYLLCHSLSAKRWSVF